MTKLVPFTTDKKLALLARLNMSGFNEVDMVSYFRFSPDCVANNVIFRCTLKKARVYLTTQTVKLSKLLNIVKFIFQFSVK